MNKYILALAIFSTFLFGSYQLMSVQLPKKEQVRLNEQLLNAAEAGDKDTVIRCLEQGANVNHLTDDGATALIRAASYGHKI